jgi:Fe-S-cluster containining protein
MKGYNRNLTPFLPLNLLSLSLSQKRNPYFTTDPTIERRLSLIADPDCIQCGKCCERWGWDQKGIPEDLIPWLTANRQDILRYVSIHLSDGTRVSGSEISVADLPRIIHIHYWQNPGGKSLRHCPFLRRFLEGKASCAIHDCKPAVCREFTPWTWENNEFYGNCPACREKAS